MDTFERDLIPEAIHFVLRDQTLFGENDSVGICMYMLENATEQNQEFKLPVTRDTALVGFLSGKIRLIN